MSVPIPKKMVSRSVAVALGIICIILVAGLGMVLFIGYSPTSGSLQTTYNDYVSNHHHTDDEYNSLNSQKTSLQNQVNDLTSTLNLGKSTVWVNDQTVNQGAGSYYGWDYGVGSVPYAGYVLVNIQSSTTDKTYVRVIYSSHGVNYDNQIGVGTSGTAVFPVLSSSIEIRVGNSNFINGATETVTVTYYY
jgi:hypothetical protein